MNLWWTVMSTPLRPRPNHSEQFKADQLNAFKHTYTTYHAQLMNSQSSMYSRLSCWRCGMMTLEMVLLLANGSSVLHSIYLNLFKSIDISNSTICNNRKEDQYFPILISKAIYFPWNNRASSGTHRILSPFPSWIFSFFTNSLCVCS